MKLFLFLVFALVSSFVCLAQRPFITTWKTDNPGVSKPNQVFLNATGTGYNVSWVNTANAADTGNATLHGSDTIRFDTAGIYKVYITPGSGSFTAIQMLENNYTGDYNKLLSIEQWGDINWSTFSNAYSNCVNMVMNATDTPNLSGVASMQNAFAQCRSLVTNAAMRSWDVSHVTNMMAMFNGAHFNEDISRWNVSHVQLIDDMFSNDSLFNQPIGNWDMSSVTESGSMFNQAIAFNQPLSNWNMSNNTFMQDMFSRATSFNQPLDSWNVGRVFSMYGMFWGASSFNQPLNDWNVSSVTTMHTMFLEASKFNQPLDKWDVSHVTEMPSMFASDSAFNQPIGNWNVGSVSDMRGMFGNAVAFNQPLANWNVSSAGSMDGMFSGASAFNQPIGNWDMSHVSSTSAMFYNARSFNQPLDSWNVSKVLSMYGMFYGASSFNQPIGSWNTGRANNLLQMFKNASAFSQNIGSWNLGSVQYMQGMLDSSGMSCSNYRSTLQGWANSSSTPNSLELGAAALTYDSATAGAAHDSLTRLKGWTIDGDKAGNCSLLPVTFLSFTAVRQNNAALLSWQAVNEVDVKGYNVEKSADGINFITTDFIGVRSGSSTGTYHVTDYNLPAGVTYYRIREVDANGRVQYSSIQTIRVSGFAWKINGNPIRNSSVDVFLNQAAAVTLQVVSAAGNVIQTISKGNVAAGSYHIPLHLDDAGEGVYIIRLMAGNAVYTATVIK